MHFFVYGRPASAESAGRREVAGLTVETLRCPPAAAMLPASFDAAAVALSGHEEIHFEPDGSILWVARQEPRWELCGVIYDGGATLAYAEMRGFCPPDRMNFVLETFGADDDQRGVVFLAREGLFLPPSAWLAVCQRLIDDLR